MLLMRLYAHRNWEGEREPLEEQKLAWVRKERLRDYPMPAAYAPFLPICRAGSKTG
jgi:8-oxo-dGTP diphosphatase